MGQLTGPKVLAIAVSAFGVVIGVNVLLAVKAVKTFPGIEVRNSYEASQTFDQDKAAQLALHWTVKARYADGRLEIEMTGPGGLPADVAEIDALVGWATSTKDDMYPELTRDGAVFHADVQIPDGNFNIRLKAVASDGTEFRQRIPLYILNGHS